MTDSMMSVCLFGYITKFDIDCPDAINFRCGSCSGPFKPVPDMGGMGGEMVCVNMECREYNNIRQDRINPSQQYNVRVDVSDETGTLANIKIRQSMLENRYGNPTEFTNISDHTKTAFKWQLVFKPWRIILAMMLPTGDQRNSTVMLVDALPTTLEEITTKMPSPSL